LLKAEQLNAAGGVLGHKLRIYKETVEFDPKRTRSQATSAAARVMSERGIIAIIGHDSVEDALPAAISYLQGGIVFIAPTITSTGLTMHGLANLFATLPDNAEISVQTARLGFDIGLRRAVILRDRGMGALEISLAYRDESAVLGIVTVEERSFPLGTSPREFLAGLQGLRFDHLLIIGPEELQIALVKFASELGINVTCVLPTISNVNYMREQIGHIAPRVLIPVLRDRSAPTPEQAVWERDYSARFGAPPIDAAIQGTDAVGLLAEGLGRVGTVDLAELGLVLHTELAYSGIGGRISFRQNGRIYTRLLGFASVRANEVAYYMPGA
jgi:branched-chain amino acid transport system substrate-binding protein